MSKVSRRGGFSDRNRIKPENTEIQLKDFDSRTRVQFQNMLSELYQEVYDYDVYYTRDYIQDFFRYVMGTIYSEPYDTRNSIYDDDVWDMIKNTLSNDEYDDVLTLIEGIIQYWALFLKQNAHQYFYNPKKPSFLFETVNKCFKQEYVGYRFVDGIIVSISDEIEIKSIIEALDTPYRSVREHLSKSNKLLADRNNPDYENSIKESISAVEALCKILIGDNGKEATLGKMLKNLEGKGIKIHPGLKSAFTKLYGYTSDADGIRHASGIGGPESTFEEAKFMLVACTAFVNYLISVKSD